MTLQLERSEYFWADLGKRVDWYRQRAGTEIAERFISAVQSTLAALCAAPGLGRPRFLDWPELAGMRSFRIEPPFHRHLIFYRFNSASLFGERLIHAIFRDD
jgi:plasmid stabilization system protein ParE